MVRRAAGSSVAGGIRWLLGAVWGAHRAALAFDFRRFASVSIEEVGRSVSYWEALALIHEFEHERSHFWAAEKGWSRPASIPDIFQQVATSIAARDMDMYEWPWAERQTVAAPADPDEVAAGLALLEDDVKIGGDDV